MTVPGRTAGRAAGRNALATFLAAALLLAAACGSSRRAEPLVGPLALTDPVLVRGEQSFMTHCHQCHPAGDEGVGPSLNDKPWPTWLMRFQVRTGLGVMPSFSSAEIPPDELDALLRYLIALRRQGR